MWEEEGRLSIQRAQRHLEWMAVMNLKVVQYVKSAA